MIAPATIALVVDASNTNLAAANPAPPETANAVSFVFKVSLVYQNTGVCQPPNGIGLERSRRSGLRGSKQNVNHHLIGRTAKQSNTEKALSRGSNGTVESHGCATNFGVVINPIYPAANRQQICRKPRCKAW